MTIGDLDDAVGILDRLLDALLATLSGQAGRQGAALRYAIGDLRADAAAAVQGAALGTPLSACFADARAAGATVVGFEAVRLAMIAEAPLGLAGTIVANAGIRMALAEEASVLAATSFASSQDVFAAVAAINAGFEQAEEFAADNRDPAAYQALVAAHAAAVRDLTTRAASLPALVTYRVARSLTSHALANRLYGTVSRCDELRAENQIANPAFMPPVGTALSE